MGNIEYIERKKKELNFTEFNHLLYDLYKDNEIDLETYKIYSEDL